jgi:hypothetical protein
MTTITMQRMPDIWDDTLFWVNRKAIFGQLANWAILQSPYLVPEGLTDALIQFNNAFVSEDFFETNCRDLISRIKEVFDDCPVILSWNVAKKGNGNTFVDRYSKLNPDYDFIDLGALARNIAHSLTVLGKFDKAHNLIKELP